MRRRVLALLIALEAGILSAVVACSLQLSRDIERSGSAHRLAQAVVHTTQQLAERITLVPLD